MLNYKPISASATLMWSLLALLFFMVGLQACQWGTTITAPNNTNEKLPLEDITGQWSGIYSDTLTHGRLTVSIRPYEIEPGKAKNIALDYVGTAKVEDQNFGSTAEGTISISKDNLFVMVVDARRVEQGEAVYIVSFVVYFWFDKEFQTLRGIYDMDVSGVYGVHKKIKGRIGFYRVG